MRVQGFGGVVKAQRVTVDLNAMNADEQVLLLCVSGCLGIWVYVCVCMCVCVRALLYVLHTHTHVYTQMCSSVRLCVCVCMCMCMWCVRVCVRVVMMTTIITINLVKYHALGLLTRAPIAHRNMLP